MPRNIHEIDRNFYLLAVVRLDAFPSDSVQAIIYNLIAFDTSVKNDIATVKNKSLKFHFGVIHSMNNSTFYIYGFSGVYNHSLYIGSTNDIKRREKEHLTALEYAKHYNPILQASHDVFGADNFCMLVLESAKSVADRSKKEKKWILDKSKDDSLVICNRRTSGGNNKFGYKLSDDTKRKQSEARLGVSRPIEKTRAKFYEFTSPDGTKIACRGLKELCAKYNLNHGHLSRVARGLLKQHKGFRRA